MKVELHKRKEKKKKKKKNLLIEIVETNGYVFPKCTRQCGQANRKKAILVLANPSILSDSTL